MYLLSSAPVSWQDGYLFLNLVDVMKPGSIDFVEIREVRFVAMCWILECHSLSGRMTHILFLTAYCILFITAHEMYNETEYTVCYQNDTKLADLCPYAECAV